MKLTKITAGLAAISMLAVATSQIAFAEDAVKLTAEKVTAEQGSDFTLKVDLSGIPENGVSAAEFSVTYDASVITITGAKAGDIVNTTSDGFDDVAVFDADYSEAGRITITYGTIGDASTWVKADGTFLTITGTASGAAGSATDINIVAIDRPYYDGSESTISDIYVGSVDGDDNVTNCAVSVVAGSVTISGDGDVTDSTRKGDANLDGNVDILDIITVNKTILSQKKLEGQGFKNADIDGDSIISPQDSLSIMSYIVKLIPEL
ncbi:MAG: hypothetical protein K2K06_11105 [Oscillospiraceae bacterium]|nr:hypothetical protein [Ruminococcus sp.]MDE6708569.1 hypothetical protein [Oscillospiraceae bacterium]